MATEALKRAPGQNVTDYSLVDWMLTDARIPDLARDHAAARGIPARSLQVKTYLHLPRFTGPQLASGSVVSHEVARLADILGASYEAAHLPALRQDLSSQPLSHFVVRPAAEEEIGLFTGRLHYLASVRDNSVGLRLSYTPRNWTVGVITISQFDLWHVHVEPFTATQTQVVSRIFTLDNLPMNATSYFIGAAIKWIRANLPRVRLLLTYLNPNVGYRGTIYRATNWVEFAREYNVRYNYLDKDYVTDRLLQRTFGTARRDRLLELDIPHLEFSRIDLRPLRILAYPLDPDFQVSEVQDATIVRV